jgi:hypothetical protein
MNDLRYTLLADGPSDDALLPVLSWLLSQWLTQSAIQAQWADLRRLPARPKTLPGRIEAALELYPCDLLFIHRDAEREPPGHRVAEIRSAVAGVEDGILYISVVPVRMMEAWLLFNEAAIRRAAGNPNGQIALTLPTLRRVEDLPDPKGDLQALLRLASGLRGRRLKDFHVSPRRVAGLIDDFSPLRALPAFQRLEVEVRAFAGSWPHAV